MEAAVPRVEHQVHRGLETAVRQLPAEQPARLRGELRRPRVGGESE